VEDGDKFSIFYVRRISMTRKQDEFYMGICYKYADERSTCLRRKVGAVLVKNDTQLTGGFNGAPRKVPHCTKETCIRIKNNVPSGERHELCIGAHAESNAINQAAKFGISVDGATLYCTTYPCSSCAKQIVNSGIVEVVYKEGYGDELTNYILQNIIVRKFE
jgi:dCMP deaminase